MTNTQEIIEILTAIMPEVHWLIHDKGAYGMNHGGFVELSANGAMITISIENGKFHLGGCGTISLADPDSLDKVRDTLKHCLYGNAGNICSSCRLSRYSRDERIR